MQSSCDIVIIGAGIAGLSVASELAGDHKVIVLEREEHPGYHATGRSAAIYLPTYGPPSIQSLTRASGSFFHNPPESFCDQPLLTPRQTMLLARQQDEQEVKNLLSIGMTEISAEQAVEKIPVLKTQNYQRFLLDAETMDIDVGTLLAAYRKKFRQQGGTLLCDSEVQAIRKLQNNWQVTTANQTCNAPIVINAAGAWASQIGQMSQACEITLQPMRRSAALIDISEKHDAQYWPLTATADESFYFRPIGQKLMISPADKTPVDPHDAWADDLELARAVELFQDTTGIKVTHIEHTWAGLRTFAPDGDPVIGFDPYKDGFFWLAGQGGYGIQTAPAISRLAASMVSQNPVPEDIATSGLSLSALSPYRFVQSNI